MSDIVISNLACAALYSALAGLVAARWRKKQAGQLLVLACASTALWALNAAWASPHGRPSPQLGAVLEVLRSVSWIWFLARAYADGLVKPASRREIGRFQLAALAFAVALIALELGVGGLGSRRVLGVWFDITVCGHLVITSAGLVLLEALVYRSSPETRWRAKYLCVGVGLLLFYDLMLYSEALLFGRLHPTLLGSHGAVAAVAVPLLSVAPLRHSEWFIDFYLARRAVFRSVALLGIGTYLFAIAFAGTLVETLGGRWGQVLQVTFLSAAAVLLAVLVLNRSARSFLQKKLAQTFFAPRYDYRAEWQRFVRNLSSPARGQTLRERALRAVADIVDSPQGALWLLEEDVLVLASQVGPLEVRREVPADGPFARALAERGEKLLLLDAVEGATRIRELGWLPEWLRGLESAWLVVPLEHRSRLMGFIVLSQPRVSRDVDWEDERLLRIVAHQTASYLAEEQAIRALEETGRFREISRRLAFLAHDLRNLTNELSLSLSNARRHIENPEFQRDLFATMEDTVAGMHRLLDAIRSRERDTGARGGSQAPVDLVELARRFTDAPPEDGPELVLDPSSESPCPVAGDHDQLLAVTGHLIRNAIEAAGIGGQVKLQLSRTGGRAILEICDDGAGMSAEFLRERLHHPFQSTKDSGYGLGLYECRQVVKDLGGSLEIESEPGRGSRARLSLPLLDGDRGALAEGGGNGA